MYPLFNVSFFGSGWQIWLELDNNESKANGASSEYSNFMEWIQKYIETC